MFGSHQQHSVFKTAREVPVVYNSRTGEGRWLRSRNQSINQFSWITDFQPQQDSDLINSREGKL